MFKSEYSFQHPKLTQITIFRLPLDEPQILKSTETQVRRVHALSDPAPGVSLNPEHFLFSWHS